MALYQSLRPDLDIKKVGVLLSTGTNAATLVSNGGNVPDYTGADDNTYIRAAAGSQYPNAYYQTHLNDLNALAANQRIKQLRVRARVRMNAAVANDAAIVNIKLTDPQSGLGIMPVGTDVQSTGIDRFEVAGTTVVGRTGAWHPTPPPLDGNEWSRAMVNRLRLELAWYYGQFGSENLRVTELYVDVDVRDRPTVTGVTVSGQDATTRPTVTWNYQPNVDGDPQITYQVKIFSSAQYSLPGFDPATTAAHFVGTSGPPIWDSGTRFGSGEQVRVETDLVTGGTYKAYVWAAQDFNGDRWWTTPASSSAFTVSLTPPPAPVLSVTSDPSVPNLRNTLQFTATLNALAADDADLENSVGNWVNGGGFSAVARSTAQARHGAASLALTANGTATPFATATGNSGAGAVATRPGAQHTLAGYVRANTTTRAWRLVLRWHDAANAYLSQTNGATVTDSNSAWTALPSVTGTAPANAVFVYAQVETTATPANGEVHYFDQLQLVPGASAPPWAPGFLATSYAVIEAAVASTKPRNQASRQLYGGGDDTRDASGFFTSGATSTVTFDMLDRVRGIGSIRWEVEDTTAKLYLGWPSGTLEDPSPRYTLAAVPGRVYTFSVYLRGTAPFSSQLNLQAINATGTTVGSAANGGPITVGTGWTRYSASITIPVGAVYVRPQLDNTAGVTGRKVWVDAAQWELGSAVTDLTRPGGQALTWVPVRGFTVGKTPVPAGTQSLVAFDHEVPPGFTVIYRAWIFAFDPFSGEALSSPLTAYAATLIDPPGSGRWVLSEVGGTPFLRGTVNVLPGLAYTQTEDVTVYHPLRPAPAGQVGQRPVALSDWIGGHDGTLQLAALSDDDFWLLERLLAVQDPLWLTESQGGGKYLRLTDRAWTRTRFRDKCVNLADGTRLEADEWEQVLTLGYVHADRPPDNEAAVLFDVESISGGGGGGGGELVFPGAPTNFIDSATCCNSSAVNTVGGVTQDFGGNAGCNTAGTSPYDPAEPVSQWGIAGAYRRVEWKVRVDDDEPTHDHAWLLRATFAGAGGLTWEAGLHRNSTLLGAATKLAVFEVPGAIGAVAGTAVGAAAQSFTGGRRVVAPFAWTLSQSATLRVQADDVRGADWWRLDVTDDLTLAITYIGSVQVPAAWGDIDGTATRATTEWLTPASGGGSFATRPSSVYGGGFQNTGCFAPAGVGHQWLSISGGDVGGFAVTADGVSWRPANGNLLNRNQQRVSCVEGSRTTPNRIYAWTSSNDGLGSSGGFLLRGTFQPATGLIDWVTVVQTTQGTQAGNVGDNHPRQVGRTMALDEANDTAVVGSINGLAVVAGISGGAATITYRALPGHHVTGVVLDPTNTQLAYCTVDDDGGIGQAGVHRVVNIRSGTVSSVRHTALTNPQDIQLATVAGVRYCWVAAMTQGIWRWTVGSDITTGWTDLTGTLVTTQGYAGVDVNAGAALSSTRVLASTSDSTTNAVDGGAWSTNGGSTWSRESTSWTVNPNPVGSSQPWWLQAAQVQALLNGNTYESECPRINPADPTMAHIHGRSGVWQTTDGAVNWRPSVNGQCVSGGIACAWDPTNPARVVLGDNDWDLFRSTDRLVGMPDQEEPSGASGPSTWDAAFRPSGKLAVGIGTSSNTLGEVYTTLDPWAATVTWTGQGFGAAGGGGRCKAVAIGQDAAATEVILAVVEGSGIYRKVGAAAPTLVSTLVTGTQTTFPKFWWPTGGTTAAVYLAAATGLYRSLDYGATWASVWAFTQTYEFAGQLAGDPTTATTLYVTVDDGTVGGTGLFKVTSAATTPVTTKIGPALDPPGQCAVDPTTGQVLVVATMDTPGGPRLYRSPAANPGAGTVFDDLTDGQWAAGVMQPRMLAVATDGTVVASNAIGGHFVAETVGAGLTSCLQIPRVTGFFATPGFASTLGSIGGGDPTAVAQPLLLGLHRPTG